MAFAFFSSHRKPVVSAWFPFFFQSCPFFEGFKAILGNMTYSCCMVPKTLCRTLSFHSALPKGHLGLCEPADFTNQLLKFYSLNKSVNLEKWGPRPSTGQRNVSLLRRLTPDVIKWLQYTLTAIRAVRFNESLHSCSFLCSLIRIWRVFFPHRQCTRIPYTSSHGG